MGFNRKELMDRAIYMFQNDNFTDQKITAEKFCSVCHFQYEINCESLDLVERLIEQLYKDCDYCGGECCIASYNTEVSSSTLMRLRRVPKPAFKYF